MISLRDYQTDLINRTVENFRLGKKSALIVLSTGGGKTVCFCEYTRRAKLKNKQVLILVHRQELLDQVSNTLNMFKMNHSFIAPKYPYDICSSVQVGSVLTVVNRLNKIRKPDLIIIDESHHAIKGSSWSKILDAYPDAYIIGVTATPSRLSGEGLGDIFSSIIEGPPMRQLIDSGFLCNYKIFAPSKVNLSGVHMRGGDYAKDELVAVMDKPSITGDAVREYKSKADGKKALVFCVSVEHAKHVANQFNESGYSSASLDGKMEHLERKKIVKDFRDGKIKVLTNCGIVTEGFDLPDIEVGILLRPTESLALYLQMCGRCLRVSKGKSYALILDHAGNCLRHGFPDEPRQWSLQGNINKKNKSNAVSVRICGECFAAVPSACKSCTQCGHVFPINSREVAHIDGELKEINPNEQIFKSDRGNELWRAQTREQLVALAKERGYKNPFGWAHVILQGRQRKKLAMVK